MRQISQADSETYEVMAESLHLTYEEILAAYWPQEDFAELAFKLENGAQGGYVASKYLPGDASANGEIYLNRTPTVEEIRLVEDSALKVRFSVLNQASLAETNGILERASRALDLELTEQFFVINVDPQAHQFRVEISNLSLETKATVSDLLQPLLIGSGLELVVAESSEQGDLESLQVGTIQGGGSLSAQQGACAAAFVVSDSISYGISTADHCYGAIYYQGFYAGTEKRSIPADGDVSWFVLDGATVSNSSAKFQSDTSTFTTATAVINPVLNQVICKFGIGSGRSCGTVYSLSTSGNGYSRLVALSTLISQPGDSGAPFFSGGTAVGILSGYSTIGGVKRTQLTRISAVNLLNAHIVTPSTP